MPNDIRFCSVCGTPTRNLRGCCSLPDDTLAPSAPAPDWEALDFPMWAMLTELVRCGGQATERALNEKVCITGEQRSACVRDLDPPRGDSNLILRSPSHGKNGELTRLYRLTPAGLAAFASSNPGPSMQARINALVKRLGISSKPRHRESPVDIT